MNGKFDLVEMSNGYFHHGFLLPIEESHESDDLLQNRGCFFFDGHNQHTQILARKDGAQSGRDGRVAGNLQGPAAIDGGAQVAQKCHAGWACLDMFAHLFAGKRFHSVIQVFGEVGEQIAAFRRTLPVLGLGLGNVSPLHGAFCATLIFRNFPQELVHLPAHA